MCAISCCCLLQIQWRCGINSVAFHSKFKSGILYSLIPTTLLIIQDNLHLFILLQSMTSWYIPLLNVTYCTTSPYVPLRLLTSPYVPLRPLTSPYVPLRLKISLISFEKNKLSKLLKMDKMFVSELETMHVDKKNSPLNNKSMESFYPLCVPGFSASLIVIYPSQMILFLLNPMPSPPSFQSTAENANKKDASWKVAWRTDHLDEGNTGPYFLLCSPLLREYNEKQGLRDFALWIPNELPFPLRIALDPSWISIHFWRISFHFSCRKLHQKIVAAQFSL